MSFGGWLLRACDLLKRFDFMAVSFFASAIEVEEIDWTTVAIIFFWAVEGTKEY
jgi:hypothetical protein